MKIIFYYLVAALLVPALAFAETELYVQGAGKLVPIALPQLCLQSGSSTANREIPEVAARDLSLSGFFEVLNPNSFVETPGKCGGPEQLAYSDWSVIGAEGLVRGIVSNAPGGGTKVQLFLYDVSKQKMVLGKEYEGDASQTNKIAHKFANEIMRYFTGEAGPFGTQIAFSSKVGRFKELFMMDMDGSNLRQLTDDRSLAVSPSWSATGKQILYTSYRKRMPDLFVFDIAGRRGSQLTQGPEMELGARYSNDGSKVVISSTAAQDSDIALINAKGKIIQKLTTANGAIDVSPDWSPDDSKIVFCSNRSGGPQIYVMGADGSIPHRISFVTSNYCTSPRWSPKGDKIAFVCRSDGGFQLFVSGIDGSNALQLTSGGDNEDPDWSPDGRYLIFSTTMGGKGAASLALMRSDGSNMKRLTTSRGGDSQPSWGPVLP